MPSESDGREGMEVMAALQGKKEDPDGHFSVTAFDANHCPDMKPSIFHQEGMLLCKMKHLMMFTGEMEIISSDMEKERVVGTLRSGEILGEDGALCCRPHRFTYRAKTISQLLRLRTNFLIEAMKNKPEDNTTVIKNLLEHQNKQKGGGDYDKEDRAKEFSINFSTVANISNVELLKAGLDPNMPDSEGKTLLSYIKYMLQSMVCAPCDL